MTPSFYALYRQGRFRKGGELGCCEEGMHQVERFAVAMVAFALEHDHDFCRAFCQNVCEIEFMGDIPAVTLEVEVDGMGDLGVQIGNHWFFVEFKVEAPLDLKQDPTKEEFRRFGGYGRNIEDRYGRSGTYILLQQRWKDLHGKESEPRCLSKTWGHVRACYDNSTLVIDLFKSLGSLKVDEFIYMNTANLNLGKSALDACKLENLLDAVEFQAFQRKSKTRAELQPGASEGAIGRYFRSNDARWATLLQSPDRHLGWFGYENEDLSIWLDCGDKEKAEKLAHSLSAKFGETAVVKRESDLNVSIKLPAQKSSGDQEWFLDVFQHILATPRKT
jgi:hypothetical protein